MTLNYKSQIYNIGWKLLSEGIGHKDNIFIQSIVFWSVIRTRLKPYPRKLWWFLRSGLITFVLLNYLSSLIWDKSYYVHTLISYTSQLNLYMFQSKGMTSGSCNQDIFLGLINNIRILNIRYKFILNYSLFTCIMA